MILIKEYDYGLKQEIVERTEKLREDIKNKLGVSIPGITFRKNDEHSPTEFALLINEITLIKGSVEGEGNELLDNLIIRIQDIIEKKLSKFVGHQVVDKLLDKLLEKNTIDTPDITELSDFTLILRTLLEDKIPITDLGEILQEYMKCAEKQMKFDAIYENIRMLEKIRTKLPGNNDWHKFYTLSSMMEEKIESSIIDLGYKYELDLDITSTNSFFKAIGEEKSKKRIMAILVNNPSIRKITQHLVHVKYPSIPVLSCEEHLDQLHVFIKTTLI